jgi:hypothetical protein
VKVAAPVYLD